ncbi:MAG: hypothetical protein JXA30_02890 [Deltaproteobacteria bacterium]|nr:hypothetical protein [Deltaproteobacteria bacterium]
MVLAVPDEPVRGRKPVLRDELAAVVFKQQYPPERLPWLTRAPSGDSADATATIGSATFQTTKRLRAKWREATDMATALSSSAVAIAV